MPERWPSLRWIAAATATIFLVWGAVRLLAAISTPLFLFVAGILLAFLVHWPIDFFSRWLPRPLATLVTLLLLLAILGAVGAWIVPHLVHQGAMLASRVPGMIEDMGAWWNRLREESPLVELQGAHVPERVEQQLIARFAALVSGALPLAYGAVTAVLAAVFVLGVAFFLAYRPGLYVDGILRIVPRDHEESVRLFLARIAAVIRGWIGGALVSMTFVGAMTALGTWLIGLDGWLLLAFVAFAFEIVPYAGPFISLVPAMALALSVSPTTAIYTALLYLAIQQVEGNAVTPIVMKKAIEIPPALLLLWQIGIAAAFGFVALFVAAPLLAALLVAVDHFYVKRTLRKG